MKTYRMVLFVRADQLSTIHALLENADGVEISGHLTDAADATALPPAPPPRPVLPVSAAVVKPEIAAAPEVQRVATGQRNKSDTGYDLILELLHSGPADLDDVKRVFEHRGFAPASAAVYVSKMLKDGRIRRGMRGRLHLNTELSGDGVHQSLSLAH